VTNRLAAIMTRTGIGGAASVVIATDDDSNGTTSVSENGPAEAARWMIAALTAAMLHDYDHPHLSNQYLVAMVSEAQLTRHSSPILTLLCILSVICDDMLELQTHNGDNCIFYIL
jgi:hypothetical protein